MKPVERTLRSCHTACSALAVLVFLLAVPAQAGIILTLSENVPPSNPAYTELAVELQVTGTEGLRILQYDIVFGGTGISATTVGVFVPGNTANCTTVDPPGPATAPPCTLDEIGPPNADGTNYTHAAADPAVGPYGGTYTIAFQEIDGWDGVAQIANVYAIDNVNDPITDITLNNIPEPATSALIGLGLAGLAIGGRTAKRRSARRLTSPEPDPTPPSLPSRRGGTPRRR